MKIFGSVKFILLVIVLLVLLIYVYLAQFRNGRSIVSNPVPIHIVKPTSIINSVTRVNNMKVEKRATFGTNKNERLAGYYKVYKDPFVIFIRQAINRYLNGDSGWTSDPKSVGGCDGIGNGMACFKAYLPDKFVVWTINQSLVGGEDVTIFFPIKPDKVFHVWVFKTSNGRFDLREFGQDFNWTSERIADVRRTYPNLINDKVHSL